MRDSDLKGFSAKVQARNLLGSLSTTWRSEVTGAIGRLGRGEGRISFMLDGLPGAGGGPAKALAAAQKTHPDALLHTQWELLQVDAAGMMGKVDFYRWNRRLGDWAMAK
jgi:hypothetical protein